MTTKEPIADVLPLEPKPNGRRRPAPADIDEETRARLDEQDGAEGSAPAPKRAPLTPAEILDRMREHGPSVHVATGIEAFDKLTGGGPCLGDLVIMMGAPDGWKTSKLVQLADTFNAAGLCVAMKTDDEDDEQIVTRFAQRRKWKRAEVEQRIDFAGLRDLMPPILIYDQEWTLEVAITDFAARAKDRAAAFLIDSTQTVTLSSPIALKGERERVAEVVRYSRAAARAHRMLVVLTSEMTRATYSGAESERTDPLAAGKWSSNIEYHAKILLSLQSVKGEADIIDVYIAKNKRGPSRVHFYLRGDRSLQTLVETEAPAKPDARAEKKAETKTKMLSDAALIAVALAEGKGPKVVEFRHLMRARHGSFSTERCGVGLEKLGNAVVREVGKKNAERLWLDGARVPADVLEAIPFEQRLAVGQSKPPQLRVETKS